MLQQIRGNDQLAFLHPFLLQFYGDPSSYLWRSDTGEQHIITQCEGGEQGDPLMPGLFALGQHPALASVQRHLRDDEYLFA